jgi:hypothetical protein
MTRPDLDTIATEANAATPGPWRVESDIIRSEYDQHAVTQLNQSAGWIALRGAIVDLPHEEKIRRDAQFIAHARDNIPMLVQYIRELEAELKTEKYVARAGLEWFAGEITATHDELRERILRERP